MWTEPIGHPRLLRRLRLVPSRPFVIQQPTRPRACWPTNGWCEGDPGALGIDAQRLVSAADRIERDWPSVSAFVVIRDGALAYERYFGGDDAATPVHLWSATKPFTGAAVGMALHDGLLKDIDQSFGDLIPDLIPPSADPRNAQVTIRQLLSMRSGWAWRSSTDFMHLNDTPNWVERTLTLPMDTNPGSKFVYNSGGVHLLSTILQRLGGETLNDYLQPRLFEPLGITVSHWGTSPQGETAGAFDLFLTPRDVAKFAFLYLNNGIWNRRQIIPPAWVRESLTTWGHPTGRDNLGAAKGFGYLWWLTSVGGHHVYFALGYGEQVIYIVPDLDLIVVALVRDTVPVEGLQYIRPIIDDLIRNAVHPLS